MIYDISSYLKKTSHAQNFWVSQSFHLRDLFFFWEELPAKRIWHGFHPCFDPKWQDPKKNLDFVASNIQILKKLRFAKKWNSMLCGYEILLDPQVAPTETSHKKFSSINSIHCSVGRSEPEKKAWLYTLTHFKQSHPLEKASLIEFAKTTTVFRKILERKGHI